MSSDGIESHRKWLSLQDVPESKLTYYHLRAVQDRSGDGVRYRAKLEKAENELLSAIEKYLDAGANVELVLEALDRITRKRGLDA